MYHRVLGFPFFFDDPFDLTRVEENSYWSLITSSKGYQYYRPIPAVLWKLLRDLLGYYDQSLLHAIPLISHAFSGWLLYSLLRTLGGGNWSIIPAILFLTNPFHYQVVAIVGPTAHTFAAVGILAGLNLYQLARTTAGTRARWLHLGALAASCFALWSHESGVTVVPFIMGLELILLLRRRDGHARPSPWLAAHIVAALVFLWMWFTIEKLPSTEQTSLSELHPKTLFFLQGFTYPFSAQIVWISDHLGISLGVLEVGLAALTLGGMAYVLAAYRMGRYDPALVPLIGVGIAFIVSLPSIWRLSWGYVQDGPRLLYLVAIGSSIFWGFLPALDFGRRRVTMAWRVITVLLLCGVIVQSWRFVDVRVDMFQRGGDAIDEIVSIGDIYRGQRVLILNTPSWFAQNRYEYPYGHYGVQLIPSYIGLDRIVYANSAHSSRTDAQSATWAADVSGGKYPFGPHGPEMPHEQLDTLLREGRVLVEVAPQEDEYVVREVGRLQPGDAEIFSWSPGRIGDAVWLDSIQVAATRHQPDHLSIFFAWNVITTLEGDYDTVIEIRDANGNPLTTYTGYALSGFSAPRLWQAGDQVHDSIALPRPNPGTYSVWIGLQDVQSRERMPAFDPNDQPVDGGLVFAGEIVVSEDEALSIWTIPPT